MDIVDFLLKTLFQLVGWIFGLFVKLIIAIIGGLFNLVVSAFKGSDNSQA
ncbi:MAG: hypothetical protein K2J33_00455 [Alistipes sp.]|nr:hypothetical protein [Alistipes sp.]